MLVDPNRLYLGSETYNDDAVIYFVDGELTVEDDDDAIAPESDLDKLWSIDVTAQEMAFRNEQTGDAIMTLGDGSVSFGDELSLGGDVQNLNVIDDMIRLSGFETVFEFRRSESDWDQMFEFRRQDNSDYEMHLHYGGTPSEVVTVDHEIDADLLGGTPASEYLDGLEIRNDGSLHADNIGSISFGTDLGVTATVEGVEIDYIGSQIPSYVYDNGVEVLSDANGLDFQQDLSVTVGDNNIAEINVDLPSTSLYGDQDETITGNWTFDNVVTGTMTNAQYADEAGIADGLTSAAASNYLSSSEDVDITGVHTHSARLQMATDEEFTLGSSHQFRMRRSSATSNFVFEDQTNTANTVFTVDPSTEAANYSYELRQNGNTVATQTWVENDADTLDTSTENTFTATQHFEAGVNATNGDYIAFPAYSSAPDTTGWPDGAGWFRTDEV